MTAIIVVGAGAIGTWLALRLSRIANQEVHLVARPERARAFLEHGIRMEVLPGVDPDGPRSMEPGDGLRVCTHPREAPADGFVFLAVRAYQTSQAARELQEAGARPRAVVTMQNGLGNAEVLAAAFDPAGVVAGTTSHGVTFVPPAVVRHSGGGDTVTGPWIPQGADAARDVAGLLQAAGVPVDRVADPRPALWRKVAVNAAINPLTAIHRVENGLLLDGGPLEASLREAAREVALVAQAEGIRLGEDEAVEVALRVAKRTARNRSSMLQALEAGRPLETNAITGQVVQRARRHGIEVPVNRRLLERLQGLRTSTAA